MNSGLSVPISSTSPMEVVEEEVEPDVAVERRGGKWIDLQIEGERISTESVEVTVEDREEHFTRQLYVLVVAALRIAQHYDESADP